MTGRLVRLPVLALLLALCTVPVAEVRATPDDDWAIVTTLDEGPKTEPASREEAVRIAREHFAKHRAALNAFLQKYPTDPRTFDARLRLASITAAEGNMEQKPTLVADALRELMALEKTPGIPRDKLANAAFSRISLQMQTIQGRDQEIREAVVTAARNFAARFPEDIRSPRLLVEAATLCDEIPDTMRKLLESARDLSREPALNDRIADDFRRMNALGQPVVAKIPTIQGRTIDLETLRGSVVVLVFWAAESPHSVVWMQEFVAALRKIPQSGLHVIGVSLDENRANLDAAMQGFGISWPTHFDGKGWENGVARPLGINAIPTVWVIDRRGNLRSLNARQSYDQLIRQLLRETR